MLKIALPLPADATDPVLPDRAVAAMLARHAVRSLHAELVLHPKPGLVSLHDNGSHHDMDASTFVRSLFSLRRYYGDIALAGMQQAGFARLRELGIDAERRMLAATSQVNTHRGAIFALGLLAAAAGHLWQQRQPASDGAWRQVLTERWARALLVMPAAAVPTHGMQAAARFRAGGARQQAAQGFPAVFELALPALRDAQARGAAVQHARLHAFFCILAELEDTNLLHRGGADGLVWMRAQARGFLDAGSIWAADWQAHAQALHHATCARRLSPGGSADLLAAACLVHAWQTDREAGLR